MQTDHEAGQVSIFGPDLWYGKMCREPSPAESGRARTSASSWKRSSELSAVPFMSLDLTPGHGNLLGTDFSLCWRCLDAQYWGVPQRRKRIFLIADFAGRTADKVLFVSEGLHGDTAPGV